MSGFDESLRFFLTELRNNVLQEILNTSREYMELKEKSLKLSAQLQNLVSNKLLNDYLDMQYTMDVLEINYCYLCGIRDSDSPEGRNPVGEDISKELVRNESYIRLKSKSAELFIELQAALPPEWYAPLNEYIKIRKQILDIEKFYCYGGGMRDKKQLDKRFDSTNESEWDKLVRTLI